jgi:lipopolysaccharide/colanic/teichoic acid biosynthesis glycosyltransferase/GT2 family glycosyltransferase
LPRISVIIPAYNCEKTVGATLEALKGQDFPRDQFEIILVDDGSLDNTREVVKKYPEVRYFWQNNRGPSAARNYGARQAAGEIILFTDSDCVPEPCWLQKMTAPFDNPEIVGVKGAYLTKQKERVARFCQKEFEERYRLLSRFEYIDFVDSYSAAFRKDAFLGVGGFDTSFPLANNEDVELSYKLAVKGYKMVFVPDARVYHTHSASWVRYLRVKFTRAYWRMLVYKKYPGKAVRDTYTPFSLRIQFICTFFFILSMLGLILKAGALLNIPLLQIPFIKNFWWGTMAGGFLAALLASTLPLSKRIYAEDPEVGTIAPLMLMGRSLVFVTGTGCGILAFLSSNLREKAYPAAKRAFDILVSFAGLLVIAPFFAVIAIAIRLDSPGPVIFRHLRMGKNGNCFMFYKFRTMVQDAESKKDELRALSSLQGPVFKIKNDPRITRVGKLLRRFSLDELPQLLNVLAGDMSLVGPRPLPLIDIEHPELLHPKDSEIDRERLDNWLKIRHSVPPGITGLWQVRGRSNLPLEAWFNYDLEYVKRRSFWMDIKILLRTIPVVILGKGAE